MNSTKPRVAIVGGGWAGLAAAVELCKSNEFEVTLFESSPQLGGRARSIEWNGKTLDNGQHLMIGAYQQMLDLLNTIDADINILFKRLSHRMLMIDAVSGNTTFDLQLPSLPAPLHLIIGILKTPYLSLKEKFQVLIRFNRLLNTPLKKDINVSDWLNSANLPDKYIKYLLEPVCLAALTTHPHQASAKAFQSVLQQTFNAPANFTDLLIPTRDLSQVFPALAESFILQNGGTVHTRKKIQKLNTENTKVTSLSVNDIEKVQVFDFVILATPPVVTAGLLKDIKPAADICLQLNNLQFEPVLTLYLEFAEEIHLPTPMTGIINGLCEWVFERSLSGHSNILAVVISAQGPHLQISQAQLLEQVTGELKQALGSLPPLIESKLIIEKRATFQCHPDVDQNRPGIQTKLSNLNLCGDYVYIEENNQPGLPSTLEGALRSGVKCAQTVVKQLNQNH